MYKLKNSYIERMINSRTSSAEIDFILYIARYQDSYGRVMSVYYKDICAEIGISTQKFYDILASLHEKGLLEYHKENHADLCVQLIGNDFSGNVEKKCKAGYLKVAATDFANPKFRSMKAGSKLLYLYMQRYINGKHMLVKNFYDSFCRIFGVKTKSLQSYLRELKENRYLYISKKRNKAYHYEMTMTPSKELMFRNTAYIPSEKDLYKENIEKLLESNFRRQMPDTEDRAEKVLSDIADLAFTQEAQKHRNYIQMIVAAVRESFTQQRKKDKKTPVLNAALVNTHLCRIRKKRMAEQYCYA